MKKITFILLLASLLAWVSCEVETLLLGEDYGLALDETATFEEGGFNINFSEVLEDSRCPLGVDCVWEGRALVNLAVFNATDTTNLVFATENSINLDSLIAHEYGGYLLELIAVNPYPHIDSLTITDYSVIINIDEN